MRSGQYDTLLFDLDGTLTEPYEGISKCILHALEKLGGDVPAHDSLRWCIGPPLRDTFGKLLRTEDESRISRAMDLYRARFRTHGMFENRPFPDVIETVARLSRHHTLFVVTSKPWVFAEAILAHFELEKYFWKVYGSELNSERADKKELLAYMLEREGLSPSRLLMIGDREYDVKGAKANGIECAGVLWGYGSRDELVAAGADYVLETPAQLEDLVLARKGNLA